MGAESMAGGMSGGLPYEKWTGGATAHAATLIGEMGPAAAAQREEWRKARDRAKVGNYGYSQGQRNQSKASTQESTQAATSQQMADIARAAAAGALSGGAMTAAMTNVAQQATMANAAGAAATQQASDNFAQQQYGQDQARIDAQAARWREMNDKQANISMQTTGAGNTTDYSEVFKKQQKPPAQVASGTTIAPAAP